jgi:lysozyme
MAVRPHPSSRPRAFAFAATLLLLACHGDAPAPAGLAGAAGAPAAPLEDALAPQPSSPPSASPPPSVSPPPSASPPAAGACEDLVAPGPNPPPKLDLPPTTRVRGVDVSSPAPWKTIRDAGFGFAFAGATHGFAKIASFADNWAMMKRCGLPRGAYHFLTDKSDGAVQARAFLEQIGDDPGEIPPALDVEKPESCHGDCCDLSCAQWTGLARTWVDAVEQKTGRPPMIYAVESFWNQCLCGTATFGARPLWLAGWPKFDFPEKVRSGGWSRWSFYQHAGNVRIGGGAVDLDLFHGTADDLGAFLRTGHLPAP